MSEGNLFEQDLSKMDYMQLDGWLTACYEEVEIIRDENKNDEDYFLYLGRFIDAWEHHYEQNKGLYSSKRFKMARFFTTYRNRTYLKVDYGKGRKSIQTIPYDTYENIHASQFTVWKPEVLEMIEQDISDAYEKILSIFKPENAERYKEILHEVVSEQIFTDIDIRVRVENEKGKKISEMTYKEFLDVCEENDTYTIKPEKHERRRNYNAALDACGATSITYHDFRVRRTSHKDFDKKFFINMGFALALPYESMVKLLAYNGYTWDSIGREFDDICKQAFRLGFSRKLTNELLKKRNIELEEDPKDARETTQFNAMPTLDKGTSGKRKAI